MFKDKKHIEFSFETNKQEFKHKIHKTSNKNNRDFIRKNLIKY
jgi:hypothetical protein